MYLSGKLSRTFPEPYTSMLTASLLYTQHRDLRKILIIGDPAFELADELNRFGPVTVHAVELDKKTVALGKKYLDYTPLANHRIFVTDYRLFAERIRDRNYQMIYIKTPNPSTLLNNRSYTLDFLRVLKGLLTEDGILALDLHRVANYYQGLRGRYTAVIFQTLNSAFNRSIITSGYRRMVFASDSNRHLSSEGTEVEDRFARSRHPDQALKYLLGDFYDPEEMASIEFQLTDQSIPALNTRRRPISVFLFHQIEGWYSALNLENLGTLFASLKIEYLALPMLLLLLGLVLLRTRTTIAGPDPFRWNRRALYLAVFITGFSSLSLHLLLIYRFQNSIGYTYLMIGFLSALFMAGLPLGTLLSRRYLKRSSKPPPVFLIILSQFFMILIALVVNHSSRQPPHFLWDLSLILLLILALGIATGALYPPFARLLLEAGISGGRIAGFFYAFDHLGAALGALSLSTFLLVYYGFGWSCTLLSLLLFFSVLVLLITHILPRRPQKNRR